MVIAASSWTPRDSLPTTSKGRLMACSTHEIARELTAAAMHPNHPDAITNAARRRLELTGNRGVGQRRRVRGRRPVAWLRSGQTDPSGY